MSSKSFQNASNLNGIVSILQFGAVGDGVADDTPAIRAAIAFIKAIGKQGGKVQYPIGTYKVTSNITVD